MATLTEMVAAVVLQSSAAAFSHFGVVLEAPQATPPPSEQRVVARSPRRLERTDRLQKVDVCPEAAAKARPVKA
ncbi:hypothetical protein [uncultured Phenylobacterium sp.]|uniref:hypothetical protein n=1 Tax=uncultured Phenylobacterium sp. TaxID=349273 RepID=UPI0025EE8C8F|nr:hypothetical protein [uncultured Phenylobacterium sp.]